MELQAGGLLGKLLGVPKPVLRTVFGKALGVKIWEQGRQRAAESGIGQHGHAAPVGDGEIVSGMMDYVSRRAGETLRDRGQQAKAIAVRTVYSDGILRMARTRLPRPTNDAQEIAAAAMELFARSHAYNATVEAVHLMVTSVDPEIRTQRMDGLEQAMAGVVPAQA